MSESKASYGVAQLIEDADKRQQQEWADFHAQEQAARKVRAGGSVVLGPNETMETIQPTGLPTLLAQMVNEYHGALKLNGYSGFPDRLVEGFSQMLLASAQPLLTEYLTVITTPPKLVNPDRDLGRYALYATRWERKHDYPPMPYEEWCRLMRDMEQ